MSAYADYLRANGATEDEIKVLVTPASERAYTAMQASLAEAQTQATAAATKADTYEKWYHEKAVPYVQNLERDIVKTAAEGAKAREALVTAQKRGLLNVAKDLGYELEPTVPAATAPGAPPAGFDSSKFIDRDTFIQTIGKEGDAIAAAQDIALEHQYLFGADPSKKLNFRSMRERAMREGKSVEQVWMDTYSVAAARKSREEADRQTYEKKLRDEGAEAERSRLASMYGDPNQRPPVPSTSPFAFRPQTGRDKQPWERNDDMSTDRVQRATQKVMNTVTKPN